VEAEVGRFAFDELDDPMAGVSPRESTPTETQALHRHRCDACGLPAFWNEDEEPPSTCPHCDVEMREIGVGE
jgi:rubrerythrin